MFEHLFCYHLQAFSIKCVASKYLIIQGFKNIIILAVAGVVLLHLMVEIAENFNLFMQVITPASTLNTMIKSRHKFSAIFLKHATGAFIVLLMLHIIWMIKRGIEYPFDNVVDFITKFGITLALSLPIYIMLSCLYGIVLGIIIYKRKKNDRGIQ